MPICKFDATKLTSNDRNFAILQICRFKDEKQTRRDIKVIKFNEEGRIRFPEVSCRVCPKTSDKSIIENNPAF